MAQPAFGKRDVRHIQPARQWAVKAHSDYQKKAASRRALKSGRSPLADRVMVWSAYFTLVFTAIVTYTPDAAVAAMREMGQIVTTVM